jgi:hypothetical protein
MFRLARVMYRRVAWISAKSVHLTSPKPNVGAAEGCDPLILFFRSKIKRSSDRGPSLRQLLQGICVGSEEAHQGSDDGFGGVLLDEVAGVGNRVEL